MITRLIFLIKRVVIVLVIFRLHLSYRKPAYNSELGYMKNKKENCTIDLLLNFCFLSLQPRKGERTGSSAG